MREEFAATTPVVDPAVIPEAPGRPSHAVTPARAPSGGSMRFLTQVIVDLGQDLGALSETGMDLPSLALGNHEVVLNDGKNRHTLNVTISQAPALQIQLYSDRNVGSVLIHTGEDDVTVEVDGKPIKRKTKGGQVLINLGVKQHSIRVLKNGFLEEPTQTVEIKKGEEAKLEFHLRPVPTVAELAIHGAAPGLQVSLDQKHAGTVGADGGLSLPNIAPGSHTIELTDGHRHKAISKDFKAGETLVLGPQDLVLQAAKASVRITVSPANAVVSYKGPDGKSHEVRGPSVEMEEGQYTFSANAAGYNDATQPTTVVSGKPNSVSLTLTLKSARSTTADDAFQECDTVGITRPCTKHNWLVRDVNDLAKVLHEAFYVASTGRPGPVVVDVPKDVQFAVGTYHPPRKSDVHVSYAPRVKGDAAQIRKAVALLASAKRPVIYTGGGVINSGPEASKLLRELVEATGFPITSTLMGLGAYPAIGQELARHARHARHLRSQHGDA